MVPTLGKSGRDSVPGEQAIPGSSYYTGQEQSTRRDQGTQFAHLKMRQPPHSEAPRSAGDTADHSSEGDGAAAPQYGGWTLPSCDQMTRSAGIANVRRHRPRSKKQQSNPHAEQCQEPLIAVFEQRLTSAGRSKATCKAYLYQISVILQVAARLAGQPLSVVDLFCVPYLLGRALVEDRPRVTGIQLSRWTLDQRRSAIRSLATFAWPELAARTGGDPHQLLDTALRSVAQQVGTVFRLPGGRPRKRGGVTPEREQIRAVIEVSGAAPGYRALRDKAFLTILAESGARVNALRTLDGTRCYELSDGTLRLFLHEKGKLRPRQIELSAVATARLRAYIAMYNQVQIHLGRATRIRLGKPGPMWRNSSRGCWPYGDLRLRLRKVCVQAEVRPFTPHALRRAFATDAARVFPRHEVALAGGWRGSDRMDEHYITVRPSELAKKHADARTLPHVSSVEPITHVAT